MTNEEEFNAKSEKHGGIIAQQKEIRKQVEGLTWKNAQPGCFTDERKSRIDNLAAKYHELEQTRLAVWA